MRLKGLILVGVFMAVAVLESLLGVLPYIFLYFSVLFLSIIGLCYIYIIDSNQVQNFQKSYTLLYSFMGGKANCQGYLISSFGQSFQDSSGQCFYTFCWFQQPSHLQNSEHPTPELKHSQYLLRQCDFLQLHLFYDRLQFLSPPSFTPFFAFKTSYLYSGTFLQLVQPQSSPHDFPVEKHQQYILRQNVFLHVQPPFFFFAVVLSIACTSDIPSPSESSSGSRCISACGRGELSSGCGGSALWVLINLREWFIYGRQSQEGILKKEFLTVFQFILC